jgi:hypothetical protein
VDCWNFNSLALAVGFLLGRITALGRIVSKADCLVLIAGGLLGRFTALVIIVSKGRARARP